MLGENLSIPVPKYNALSMNWLTVILCLTCRREVPRVESDKISKWRQDYVLFTMSTAAAFAFLFATIGSVSCFITPLSTFHRTIPDPNHELSMLQTITANTILDYREIMVGLR